MRPAIKSIPFLLLWVLMIHCKRALSHTELEAQMKKAMLHSLQTGKGYDATKMKFEILDVNYYEDATFYICEFHVRLHQNGGDTTGEMRSTISKDFSVVRRTL